jgi:hypothetical protein
VIRVVVGEHLDGVAVGEPEDGEAALVDRRREPEDALQERDHLAVLRGASANPGEAGDAHGPIVS